ncbi:serpin family protein [Planctomycetota bacterium]|nr:serpin family protein [Planctomycetota bacterium]
MRFSSIVPAALAALLLAPLCTAQEEARSERERANTPVEDATLADLAGRNAIFAADLYQQLRSAEAGNLFFSPHSVSQALAMAYGGARDETRAEIERVFHFDADTVHAGFNGLDRALASRGRNARGQDAQPFRLRVVNAAWGQRGYAFQAPYLDTLAENYGAGMRLLDYAGDNEAARRTVNEWVSENTEQKIPELLQPGDVPGDTKLILTNAIYFNAGWSSQFKERNTQSGNFTCADGSQVQVPFMSQTESFPHAEGVDFQAVKLPYDGRETSMVIVLPAEGSFDAFEASLSGERLNEVCGLLDGGWRRLQLDMPRWEFRARTSLKTALRGMGMEQSFSNGQADFSGMDGTHDLFIGDVIHEAYVKVNEAGTEAAAATAVIMRATGLPAAPTPFRLDRPFVFFIRDEATGAVLFLGRVVNPAE